MFVIVQSVSGPAAGKRVHLRAGQTARFGRTEWADYSFDDAALADVHFTIACDPRIGCRLTAANGSVTLVNGEEVTEASLHHGHEITAGESVFRVHIEDEPALGTRAETTRADPASEEPSINTIELCAALSFSDDAQALLKGNPTPDAFFAALRERRALRDATLFLARWLPKRQAIWWSCLSLADGAPPRDEGDAPLARAVRWIKDPSDENRRAAMDAANRAEMKTPDCWVAAAVFWSEGPLGPPEYDTPPAAEHLTAVGVDMALTLAAERGTPAEAVKRYESFLELGMQLQSGEIETPAPAAV